MRSVSRSALVPYTAEQMYALVDDIESYPAFLPWCSGAEVLERNASEVLASVEMKRAGFRKSFTTRNTLTPGESIELALVGGPFKQLAGRWQFDSLADGAGCKVSLSLDFEFESRALDALLGVFFEETCNSLVDAFTTRAAAIYT